MDGVSGLIRGVELTPANVADTDVADALIMGDEDAVYADKAYESKERRKRLRLEPHKDGDEADDEGGEDATDTVTPAVSSVLNRLLISARMLSPCACISARMSRLAR